MPLCSCGIASVRRSAWQFVQRIFDLARRTQRGFARHRAVVGNMLQARAFERMNVLPVTVFARAMRRFGRVLRAGGIVVRDVLAEDMFERRAGVGHRIRRAAASAFARLRAVDEALLAARVVRIIRNVMTERRAFRSDRVGRVAAAALLVFVPSARQVALLS